MNTSLLCNLFNAKNYLNYLIVPVGDGKGLVKLASGSGILIRRGGKGALCFDGDTFNGGSASSTSD